MANVIGNQITGICQIMDPRSLKHVTRIPIRSTKGLLLSKSYQPNYPLSTTSSKINGIEREGSFAVWIKNYGNFLALII